MGVEDIGCGVHLPGEVVQDGVHLAHYLLLHLRIRTCRHAGEARQEVASGGGALQLPEDHVLLLQNKAKYHQ